MPFLIHAQELKQNLELIFENSSDFNLRPIITPSGQTVFAAYIGNLSDRTYIANFIIKPLTELAAPFNTKDAFLKTVSSASFRPVPDQNEAVAKILGGSAVVFTDIGQQLVVYAAECKNGNGRSVSEPDTETVIRGPREGFVESAENNVALIRKRIKSTDFNVQSVKIGVYTETEIFVAYLKGVAREETVNEVVTRLSQIQLPGVMDSGYIEHFLEKSKAPIFQTVGNSEKPDKVAAKIVEGRVAIFCDGSPVVLTVPYLFVESIQSAEDYSKSPYYATFVRLIRFMGMLFSLYLPALYIALLDRNKDAIPFPLYNKIAEARKDIPFDIFTELLVILLIFELIREVGVRMPRAVGDAVGIVAGLILGDAAIKAGIASSPVIMVAALTAISAFILPPYMNSIVLIRFINLFLAKALGFTGLVFSVLFLLIFLCNKKSFGTPYLFPFAPAKASGLFDTILMLPKKVLSHSSKELSGSKQP